MKKPTIRMKIILVCNGSRLIKGLLLETLHTCMYIQHLLVDAHLFCVSPYNYKQSFTHNRAKFIIRYTANIFSEITVKTQVKTVKLNYIFFTVTWTSILPYIVQCRSVDSSLQLLHCTWSSNQM